MSSNGTGKGLDNVVAVFQKWLYLPKPEALLAVLGTVAANRLPGDPVWLMVVGPPGGGKSEILQSLLGLKEIRGVSTVTERALLSGTAKKEVSAEAKGGVLREIGAYGIIVCKDFGSLLSMEKVERARTLAALREVYDGSWTRDVGVDGGRKLHWQGKIGMIVGVTPTIDQFQGTMGAMGERFVMLRLPSADPTALAKRALAHAGQEIEMRGQMRDSVSALFGSMNGTVPDNTSSADDLTELATLVARARSAVLRESRHQEIELVPGSEAPTRLVVALDRLFGGLKAIGLADDHALQVITGVALDSIPALRRQVLETLFDAAGEDMDTDQVANVIGYTTKPTRWALEELAAHQVVQRTSECVGKAHSWQLCEWAHKRLQTAKYRDRHDRWGEETPRPEGEEQASTYMGSNSYAKKIKKEPPVGGVSPPPVTSFPISAETFTNGDSPFEGEEPPAFEGEEPALNGSG